MAVAGTLISAIVGYSGAVRLMRVFSSDAEVIRIGVDYLHIISWSFIASGVVFVSSSMFQALGNAIPPMITSLGRITLIAIPIVILSRRPGFDLRTIWYLSSVGVVVQMAANLGLLRREFRRRFAAEPVADQPSLSA